MTQAKPAIHNVLKALPSLPRPERRKLLESLCAYPDIAEDVHDIPLLQERRGESRVKVLIEEERAIC